MQDSTGYDIYASPAVNALTTEARGEFSDFARGLVINAKARPVFTIDDDVLLAAREVTLSKEARYRVYAGQSMSAIGFTPRDRISMILIVTPLLLGVSVAFAYGIAGRSSSRSSAWSIRSRLSPTVGRCIDVSTSAPPDRNFRDSPSRSTR